MTEYFHEFSSDLKREFRGYDKKTFVMDLMAGLTVAAVALPLALAFGISSGADATSGLITAIISAFLIGSLSGASFQISGPTGAMSAILLPLSAKYGLRGVMITGIIAGAVLILCGVFKLGKLVYFLPSPVIAGFTSGIAIIIALGQIDNFFGVKTEGETVISRIEYLFQHGFSPNVFASLIAVFTITLMLLWPKKLKQKIPASLIAIIVSTVFVSISGVSVALVGEIPKTLVHPNRIEFSSLDLQVFKDLALPAMSVSALCLIESLLCGVVGGRMKGEKLNGDRELIAQGIGNLVLPFFGGVPATSAIARTSVAIKSGQMTRLTGIIQGAFLLLSMFLFSPFMSKIPLSALGGILVVTAWRMNEWENIKYIFEHKFKGAATKFFITMLVTVCFDLTIAIAAGVVFSIFYFIVKISAIDVSVSEVSEDRLGNKIDNSLTTQVLYVTGPIFFGSAENFLNRALEATGQNLILSMRGVTLIDTSGAQAIFELCEIKHEIGVKVLFSSLQPNVKTMLDRAGITNLVGESAFFDNAKSAINNSSA